MYQSREHTYTSRANTRIRVSGADIRLVRIWTEQVQGDLQVSVSLFLVSVFGFRASGSGFRISGFGFRFSVFGFQISRLEFRVCERHPLQESLTAELYLGTYGGPRGQGMSCEEGSPAVYVVTGSALPTAT